MRRAHSARPVARRGFTFLEILTVMVILGVLSALSFGRLTKLMTQQRVAKAANAITLDLQSAFAIAGRNRKPVRITFDATAMQLLITDRAQTTVFHRTGLGINSGFSLKSSGVTVYPALVEVFPNGVATDTMSITLAADGYSKRVRLTRAGLVQVF